VLSHPFKIVFIPDEFPVLISNSDPFEKKMAKKHDKRKNEKLGWNRRRPKNLGGAGYPKVGKGKKFPWVRLGFAL
jgi:hypothetical protein